MTTITPPAPVPQSEYIDNLWASVKEGLITWPELRDLQAVYLRDQRPIPLPRLCRCGRPTRLCFGPRPVCRDCLRYERTVLATRATEAARRALFERWQGRG